MASNPIWRSRFAFFMASIGFAVGLGNIWRFPYVTGENGGSAFVLVYLICAFAIAVPILMAELMIGRHGRASPPLALAAVARSAARSRRWAHLGHLQLITAFLLLMVYCVVAGWVLYYLYRALTGNLPGASGTAADAAFAALLGDVPTLMLWTALVLAIAGGIIYAGVEKGIERAALLLMPMLFLLLVGLAVFNVFAGGMGEALAYLFTPDFSQLGPGMVLAAIGQAFFSIGVAMAGMMMFGAYLPKDISIGRSALIIVVADTSVALVAGLVIFPMVFHHGLDPGSGTGLIFQSLPLAFAQMPAGGFVGVLFFLLLAVAAITSVVGLMEPIGVWIGERFNWSRHRAALALTLTLVMANLLSALSYNELADVTVAGYPLAAVLDFVPSQVLLPMGGLLTAIFAGWFLTQAWCRDELRLPSDGWLSAWRGTMRFLVTPAVLLILLTGILQN